MTSHENRFPDWQTLYQEQDVKTLPWYYQELDPDLANALKSYNIRQGRFLDLGTGPGTQAVALAQLGFDVVGSDLSKAAIEKAQTLSSKAVFVEDDILNTRLEPGFDYIFDRGCFHVLPPETRSQYVQTVHHLLNPRGYLFLKPFSTANPEWPAGPYRFNKEAIHAIFEPAFELISVIDTIYQGTLAEKPQALFAVLRKV
ncbi:MAG TPA: class I SAM-dependent methyltransferase [Oculatellaceae cyanobacterium]|jgi:SAM-dependent methyltransferase